MIYLNPTKMKQPNDHTIQPRSRRGLAATLAAFAAIGLCSTASAVDRTYQYFRYTPTQLRNANLIQLSEFQFIKSGVPLDLTGVIVTNPGGNFPGNENPPKVIDLQTGTKWLDFNVKPLVFQFPAAVTIDAYNFATANDAAERDPVSWLFEGSTDGTTWSALDSIANYPTTTDRFTYTPAFALPAVGIGSFTESQTIVLNAIPITLAWSTFAANLGVTITPAPGAVAASGTTSVTPPSNSDTLYTLTASSTEGTAMATVNTRAVAGGTVNYRYVRFTSKKLRNAGIANGIQLSEFTLLDGTTALTPVTATNPGGTNVPTAGEGALKATDGSFTTKWFDGNIQPLILDLGTPTNFNGYTFGTANDSPERDPVRWTLEGSNDSTTWTLIENVTSFDFPMPLARQVKSQDIPLPGTSLAPSIELFVGDSPKLIAGQPLLLTWVTNGASSVSINNGVGTVANSGSVSVNPAVNTTYTLTATGAGSNTSTATFAVEIINPAITTINYQNFDAAGDELALLLDAAILNDAGIPLPANANRLRITPDQASKTGVAWFRKRVSTSLGFETFFDLQFNTNGGTQGADGIAFIVQNTPTGSAAIPTQVAENGLTSNALNIKFDSYDNDAGGGVEPSSAFIQVYSGTTVLTTVNLADFPGLVTAADLTTQGGTAAPYKVEIKYLPGDLDILFNGTTVVNSLNVDLGTIGAVDATGKGFVGFAARTGGFFEAHDVARWILKEGPPTFPLVLLSHSFNFGSNQLTQTWESTTGKTYRITTSPDLMSWTPVLTAIPGAAGQTSRTISFTPGTKAFFRVEQE